MRFILLVTAIVATIFMHGCRHDSGRAPVPGPVYSISFTGDLYTYYSIRFQCSAPVGSTLLWNFGDGDTSTAIMPAHTFLRSGAYTVSVMVNNDPNAVSLQTLQLGSITEKLTRKYAYFLYGYGLQYNHPWPVDHSLISYSLVQEDDSFVLKGITDTTIMLTYYKAPLSNVKTFTLKDSLTTDTTITYMDGNKQDFISYQYRSHAIYYDETTAGGSGGGYVIHAFILK